MVRITVVEKQQAVVVKKLIKACPMLSAYGRPYCMRRVSHIDANPISITFKKPSFDHRNEKFTHVQIRQQQRFMPPPFLFKLTTRIPQIDMYLSLKKLTH